ncbi:MAG TPA: hypothetical protein VHC70_15580, partial [Phycisphaerales bacterium]|nr:hypothetical protein [Phycisphaerales bacterium]
MSITRSVLRAVFCGIALAGVLSASTPARADTCYGTDPYTPKIFQVNLQTGELSNAVPLTLAGFTAQGATALTANPLDGTIWGVVKTAGGMAGRKLCVIDPATGVATLVGAGADLPLGFSSLSFSPEGVLYGMTGNGGTPASTLYTLDTCTGAATMVYGPVISGPDGEVIAFGPGGTLYHSSGNGTATFSIINLAANTTTALGDATGEMFGMGYSAGQGVMYGSDIDSNLFRIDLSNGSRTMIGLENLPGYGTIDVRGLAIIPSRPTTEVCYGSDSQSNRFYQINLDTGAATHLVAVVLPGFTVYGVNSVTASPVDGSVWGVVKTASSGSAGRKLCRIDPATGNATLVGAGADLPLGFSSLSFNPGGVLYGMTGAGGTPASTLYTLDTTTGVPTVVYGPVISGPDGEVIAFGPGGTLYHSSGNGTATFSIINLAANATTPLGTAAGEMFGMAYSPARGVLYGTDISANLFRINLSNGARTNVGPVSLACGAGTIEARGLAIVRPGLYGACCLGGGVCTITLG